MGIILKDTPPYTDKPNAHIAPVDFERELATFKNQYDENISEEDFLSYKMYPKVYDEFYKFKKVFGDVWVLPTTAFYYPLKANEEIIISLDRGKNLLVRFIYISEPNDEGIRDVFFKINGQTRSVAVKDASIQVNKEVHYKVQSEKEIGATLQGKLIPVLVNDGDEVKKNQPLFTVEAMKMESTITAQHQGIISKVYLKSGVLVEQDDCVVAFV